MSKAMQPRIRPNKAGNYYVLYNKNGRSRTDSLRTKDVSVAAARFQGWLDGHRIETGVSDDPIISDILEWWMDQWIRGRMLSEDRYPSVVKNLNKYFGNMRVSEITRKDSAKYIELRRNGFISGNSRGAADSTIYHEMKELIAAFNFMTSKVEPRERRLIKEMLPFIEVCQKSPARDRVLSKDELQSLKDKCLKDAYIGPIAWRGIRRPSNRVSRISRFLWLAMETAQRKTAILELKWSQVDFEMGKRGLIFFNPEGRNQTSKRRPPLPISSKLLEVLKIAYDQKVSDYVLDKPTGLDYQITKFGEEVGIERLHAHLFRHTWATHRAMEGKTIEKIAQFLGDTEETVRKNYIHLTPDYLEDVVD